MTERRKLFDEDGLNEERLSAMDDAAMQDIDAAAAANLIIENGEVVRQETALEKTAESKKDKEPGDPVGLATKALMAPFMTAKWMTSDEGRKIFEKIFVEKAHALLEQVEYQGDMLAMRNLRKMADSTRETVRGMTGDQTWDWQVLMERFMESRSDEINGVALTTRGARGAAVLTAELFEQFMKGQVQAIMVTTVEVSQTVGDLAKSAAVLSTAANQQRAGERLIAMNTALETRKIEAAAQLEQASITGEEAVAKTLVSKHDVLLNARRAQNKLTAEKFGVLVEVPTMLAGEGAALPIRVWDRYWKRLDEITSGDKTKSISYSVGCISFPVVVVAGLALQNPIIVGLGFVAPAIPYTAVRVISGIAEVMKSGWDNLSEWAGDKSSRFGRWWKSTNTPIVRWLRGTPKSTGPAGRPQQPSRPSRSDDDDGGGWDLGGRGGNR